MRNPRLRTYTPEENATVDAQLERAGYRVLRHVPADPAKLTLADAEVLFGGDRRALADIARLVLDSQTASPAASPLPIPEGTGERLAAHEHYAQPNRVLSVYREAEG
jgi:hypothetical protein